jgi:hypothetical protein
MKTCSATGELTAMCFQQRLRAGAFVTEFGAVSNSLSGVEDAEIVLNLADEWLRGWLYWQWKRDDDITTGASMLDPLVVCPLLSQAKPPMPLPQTPTRRACFSAMARCKL